MKHHAAMLFLATAVLAGVGCEPTRPKEIHPSVTDQQAEQKTGAAQPAGGRRATLAKETPLRLLDDEPLLLDENGMLGDTPTGAIADNSRCHVCHINYVQEDLALAHARANIGCAGCHGSSDAHIADESWSWGENGTPPDAMYRRDEINSFCMGCHPREQIALEEHRAFFEDVGEQVFCTDCHGRHRLARRKSKWK